MKTLTLLVSFLLCCPLCGNADDVKKLWQGFHQPQDSCRTKVWWFHGETETTREGITADLEAYKKQGVGGVVYYDQVHGKGEHALEAFSPEWWKMFIFAAQEAKRIGLKFETHFSNGYCAGGPWITDDLGMQMLVSTDTLVKGGQGFDASFTPSLLGRKYHGNVAVLAFPAKKAYWGKRKMQANRTITTEEGTVSLITDMGKTFTARSLTYNVSGRSRTRTRSMNVPLSPTSKLDEREAEEMSLMGFRWLPNLGELEASDDGKVWRKVCTIKPSYSGNTSWKTKTISFPAVSARYFRLHLHDWQLDGEKELKLGDFTLSSSAMVDEWEVKAALISDFIDEEDAPLYDEVEVIRPDEIIDLTSLLEATEHLTWRAPKGNDWVVMRFDHIPTRGGVKHGRKNLMGLECDKLSAKAAKVQWDHYFKVMLDTLSKHHITIDGLHIDSHEAGAQNWTSGFEKEFMQLRHYDLKRYLPVMAGYVVENTQKSTEVLRDVRRTIADLISYRHFGTIDSLSTSVGVPFTAQAIGNGLCIVGDPIQAKGQVRIPQGEFWNHHPDGGYDIKESSSAAHLYNKQLASGEAFTDVHFDTPLSYIKTLADNAYCYGLNEFVVCASAYQPWLDKFPGSTGGGRHYCLNRNNTYWDYSKPFWDYQARCTFLMRQGKPVIDYCVYLGDDAPVKIRTAKLPQLPVGTDFDAFTSDALFKRMTVKEGRIVLPDGMNYTAMVIPSNVKLIEAAKQKIDAMRQQGMKVYETQAEIDVPDIALAHGNMKEQSMWYTHRRTEQADIYFVSNHGTNTINDQVLLRCQRVGQAEWWNPTDGSRHTLSASSSADGRTVVSLSLAPKEAGFIVLSEDKNRDAAPVECGQEKDVLRLNDSWDVYFDPKWGGAGVVHMDSLYDWTKSDLPSVRNYSGTAKYTKTFKMSKQKQGARHMLRLKGLHDAARVWINGEEAGIIWCSPFELDITSYLRKGKNEIRLDVVNTWTNRMIYDTTLPKEQRLTYAYPEVVKLTDALISSGLTDSVEIVTLLP